MAAVTLSSHVQELIVGVVVAAAFVAVARQLAPRWMQARQLQLAMWCASPARPKFVQALGRRAGKRVAAGGCDTGCGNCSTSHCGPAPQADDVQPVHLHRRSTGRKPDA